MSNKEKMWVPNSIKGFSQNLTQNDYTGLAEVVGGNRSFDESEKRASSRYPSRLQARFFYGDKVFKGVLRDVSETGMFISTDMKVHPSHPLSVMILINEKVLQIPVTIKRIADPDDIEGSGIGVELLRVPQTYLNYVKDVSIHNNTPSLR